MAGVRSLRDDVPNPEIELWRQLSFDINCILGARREPDPFAEFGSQLHEVMYRLPFSLEAVIAVITPTLLDDNPDCRSAAARLLGCVAKAIAQTSSPVTLSILGALTTHIEALTSEQDVDTCEAEIDAIVHFAAHDGVRVARALIDFAGEQGTDLELRKRAFAALRKCPPDVVVLATDRLLSLLTDESALIRRETCRTLGALGLEGFAAIRKLLNVMLGDKAPSVKQEAARALTSICTDRPSTRRIKGLKDTNQRRQVLSQLAGLGEEGRALRRALAKEWRFGVARRGPPRQQEATSRSEARFSGWAIGIEHDGKWHVFKRSKTPSGEEGKWRHYCILKGLAKGRQERLLKAFAEGGGLLSVTEVLRLEAESDTLRKEQREEILDRVKPEISKLRRLIIKAIKLKVEEEKAPNPIHWSRNQKGWRAIVEIGYATQDNSSKPAGSTNLQFMTRERLSPDEKADRRRT